MRLNKLVAELTSRCCESWESVFGTMTTDDWLFLVLAAWFVSLFASLAWILFAT